MSDTEDESLAEFSHQITASSRDSSNNTQIEFGDVVEKLNFAIDNVRQLKPWKDRAVRAERENRHLSLTVATLKDELLDSEYEVEKWKKRALRAEQENQDEIEKWKNKAMKARESVEIEYRDDSKVQMRDENYPNLITGRDDDDSTIATNNDSKSITELTGRSFRSKWKNMGFKEEKKDVDYYDDPYNPVSDDNTTVAAEEIIKNFESGMLFESSKGYRKGMGAGDNESSIEVEDILNNYLNMKGRNNSRRFDTSSNRFSADSVGAVHNTVSEEVEI